MRSADLLREAIASLLAHRLRSYLSTLGLVAGVATVVSALAFARGAGERAYADIAALGIDNIVLRVAAEPVANTRRAASAPVLTLEHAEAIAARVPRATVAALRSARSDAEAGGQRLAVTVAGVTPAWPGTSGLRLRRGRWLTAADAHSRHAVVSAVVAEALFGGRDVIGERVLAAGEWRTVVGVLEPAGQSSPTAVARTLDLDRAVLVPVATMDLMLGAGDRGTAVQEIVVKAGSGAEVARIAPALRTWVTRTLGADAGAIEILVPRELLAARARAERSFHLLLLAIGTLALGISGVGIMNIMVASVTERAAEIGVRRAFGARRRAIVGQFALEAGCLGLAGGAIGIPAGIAAATIVASIAGWPAAVSAGSLLLALALSIGVGLAASVYPAKLAASITPIEALRYG